MKKAFWMIVVCIIVSCSSCIRMETDSKTEPDAVSAAESAAEPAAEESKEYTGLAFNTTDRDGNAWDQSVFMENSLTMINFWEPWCGPCVGEMPDLEKLSADYKDKGFAILGVYSTEDMEEDVNMVLEYTKVTYPILHYTDAFDGFQTGYVPTTVFVDAQGNVLGEPYVGSRSYKDWASIVDELLQEAGND